ncbi:MAG: DUF4339 domain-containing protein [Zavarzinella sp.]
MSQEWYYSVDGDRQGPVGPADLKKLADQGKLRPDDLVWKDGMQDWMPAKSVKGLFSATSSQSLPAATEQKPVDDARNVKKAAPVEDDEEEERPKKKKPRYDDEDEEEDDRPKKKSARYEDDEEEERPKKKKSRYDDEDEEEEQPKKKGISKTDFNFGSKTEEEDDRPKKKASSKSDFAFGADDEDEEDDRPRKKSRGKSYDDDDEEDDRPRKKRAVNRYDDEDDDDDDAPPRKKGLAKFDKEEIKSKKMVAGILGILLGGLGIHKFYLGFTGAGIIQILLNCVLAGGIIGLIEGIIYLTKDEKTFYQDYIVKKKQWF